MGVRINKFLADCGLCSRREAEKLILEHRVSINGVEAALGAQVDPSMDKVTVDGKKLSHNKNASVVLAVNKPRGLICSNKDPHNPDTVFDLLPATYEKRRLYCAGRLDKDSEGLVILTDDGTFCQRLTHPSNGVMKRYRVQLDKEFDKADIPRLLKGKRIEGEKLYAEKLIPAPRGLNAAKRLEVHLLQGRKREIRRLFEAFGYRVKRLKRFQMGRFIMKGIARGGYRKLKAGEIELLLKK